MTSPHQRPATHALHWALLALFTVCLLLIGRNYYIANKRPPTFDDAWYLDSSLHFYQQLTRGSFVDCLRAYAGSFRTKAPLLSVLPLPFYLLLGARYQSAMLVNMTFLVLTNVYLFLLGRRLFSPGVALAAAVFYQTMPLAYGLSRVFMPEYGLAALVIIWIYYLAASDLLSHGPANFALGVLLGVGLLMKILFPLYIAGPLVAVLLLRRNQPPRAAEHSSRLWGLCARHPFVAMALPAVLIASTWYAFNLPGVLRFAWSAGYGELSREYGAASFTTWLLAFINQGLSTWYAGALLVLGAAALAIRRPVGKSAEAVPLLLAWLVVPLIAVAAGRSSEMRFALPILPVFAILLALAAFRVARRPALQALLAAALALFPLRLFAALSFPPAPGHQHEHPRMLGPFVLFARELGWAEPPGNEGQWDQRRIIEALHQMEPPPTNPRAVVVGVEHRFLNANLLQYLNRYSEYPLVFSSLGYAETSVDSAVERIHRLDARYIVMAEGFHSDELVETFNRVNAAVQARLDRGELPFRPRARVALTKRVQAVIYERESPWTSFAPAAAAPRPEHPLIADFAGGPRFLGYDAKRAGCCLWEISYYWTVPHRIAEDYRVNLEFRSAGRLLLQQDHFVAGGRHPFYDWQAGEVVRQRTAVYLPAEGTVDATLWLTRWGYGDPVQIAAPPEMKQQTVVPLRLQP